MSPRVSKFKQRWEKRLEESFKQLDTDGDNSLTFEEFKEFCRQHIESDAEGEADVIFQHYDRDANGTLSLAEFKEWAGYRDTDSDNDA